MRIISGDLKGRTIQLAKDSKIRPTTDKVRNAIFTSLYDKVIEADVLDCFAGSGALGFEALSRGARSGTFVDIETEAVSLNLKKLPIESGSHKKVYIFKRDFFKFETKEQYDIILLDPPYNIFSLESILRRVCEEQLLREDGVIVLEESKHCAFKLPELLYVEKERKYGETLVRYIQYVSK